MRGNAKAMKTNPLSEGALSGNFAGPGAGVRGNGEKTP
jgi:hypothetical protein